MFHRDDFLVDDNNDGTVSIVDYCHTINHQGGKLLEEEIAGMLQEAADCNCMEVSRGERAVRFRDNGLLGQLRTREFQRVWKLSPTERQAREAAYGCVCI